MDVDPRELTPGYVYAQRNLGTAYGALRDGRTVIWTCSEAPTRHKPHPIPTRAGQCAQAEQARRVAGAREVLWAGHCEPCGTFWDLGRAAAEKCPGELGMDDASYLLRGWCPRCQVPFTRTRLAVLERESSSVR